MFEHIHCRFQITHCQVSVSLGHLDRAVAKLQPKFQQRHSICYTPSGKRVSQVVNPKIRDSRARTTEVSNQP